MQNKLTKLEKLQHKKTGFNFIKSYPILNKTGLRLIEIKIIELILSYQDNNQEFYMDKRDIAYTLSSDYGTIRNRISNLKSLGVITSTKNSKYNNKTKLYVNVPYIIEMINSKEEPKELSPTNDEVIPEKEDKPLEVPKTTNIRFANKLQLIEIVDKHTNDEQLNKGQNMDLKDKIDDGEFKTIDEVMESINKGIDYNNIARQIKIC